MSFWDALALCLCVALLVYLAAALMRPELFD